MTGQIIPFPSMKNLDPALLLQLEKMQNELNALQAEQRRNQQKPQSNSWRNLTRKQDQGNDSLLGVILGAALFGGLFDSSMLGGAAQLGMMNMSENANNPAPVMDGFTKLNDDMNNDALNPLALLTPVLASSQNKNNSQMTNLLLLALLLKMLNPQSEEGKTGGSEAMAPDVLGRNHRIAQLKRNMEGVCCNKMVFKKQMKAMVSPAATSCARYNCN